MVVQQADLLCEETPQIPLLKTKMLQLTKEMITLYRKLRLISFLSLCLRFNNFSHSRPEKDKPTGAICHKLVLFSGRCGGNLSFVTSL